MIRIGELEKKYVLEVLDTQFKSSKGADMMTKLEEEFADKFNTKYAISHVNGTATMHTSLLAAGVGPGDEVIVPPLTFAATAFVVLYVGATPVFADIEKDTFNISTKSIEEKITPKTKAIIPVSIYGLSSDIDKIMSIAQQNDLIVIEDNAECFLGENNNRIVGSIAHMASFSFQASKHLTSGEGGMVITNDRDFAEKVRKFNSLGYANVGAEKAKITKKEIQDPNYLRHDYLGLNYRMSELCAAVALAQLQRLDELVEMRIKIADLYDKAIDSCNWLVPQYNPTNYKNTYWAYVVRLDRDRGISWHDFRDKYIELGGDGIYAAWTLLYNEPVFQKKNFFKYNQISNSRNYVKGLCPNAEEIQPYLLQFKTSFTDISLAKKKANSLQKTIQYFDNN